MKAGYTKLEHDTYLNEDCVVVMFNWHATNILGYRMYSQEEFKSIKGGAASNYIVAVFNQKTK